MFSQEDINNDFEKESEQYQRGYLHARDDVQRKIKMRNRDVTVNKGSLNQNQPSSSQQNTEREVKNKINPLYIKNQKIK